ncbi:MAG: hypothetical protein KF916_07260 [Microbacteriaceae bacterium]|nr:hypothetical protein [Microbacteriaceae bacterium]
MPLGLGNYDANGIWQYGESDKRELASDLLNIGQESISTVIGPLNNQVQQIDERVAGLEPGGWISPTFMNGWSDSDANNYDKLKVRRTKDELEIIGRMIPGTLSANTVIFELPPGHRPPARRFVEGWTSSAPVRLTIDPDGAVALGLAITGSLLIMNDRIPLT